MKRRLSLITEIIAPYRIPVFNALAARDDLDLQGIFLLEADRSLRQWQVYKSEIRFSYQVLPAFRKRFGKYNVLLNRGLADALAQPCPDAILCGGYNYLASWQAQRWATKRGIPFLLWLEKHCRQSAPPHPHRRIDEAPLPRPVPGLRRSWQIIASVSPPIRCARRIDLSPTSRGYENIVAGGL